MKNSMLLSVVLMAILVSQPIWTMAHNTPVPKLSEIKRQHPKDIKEQANKHYEQRAYDKAYYYYFALSEIKKHIPIEYTYRLGKTALFAREFQVAKTNLKKVLGKENRYPLVDFEYGKALKNLGDYRNAITHLKKYANAHAGEQYNDYLGIAKRHILSCQRALDSGKEPMLVEIESLGEDFEDVGGSLRSLTIESKHGIRLVEYQDDRGTCIKKVLPDNSVEALTGRVGNPIFNSKSPYIAPDGETVYFTQAEFVSGGETEYKIYVGKMNEQGDIEEIQKLGSGVNRAGFSSMYPTIGTTEHGQQILYFASTQPGGYGGYDIWYSVQMTNGEFTRAYNLGVRVNSDNDEITPFYYQEDQELYFSSNKPEGFGGHDVYKMSGEKRWWKEGEAQHLGDPVNSHGNDYHYRKDKKGNASFSTNRAGGKKDRTIKLKEKKPQA